MRRDGGRRAGGNSMDALQYQQATKNVSRNGYVIIEVMYG